jgi:hypothetical protein
MPKNFEPATPEQASQMAARQSNSITISIKIQVFLPINVDWNLLLIISAFIREKSDNIYKRRSN